MWLYVSITSRVNFLSKWYENISRNPNLNIISIWQYITKFYINCNLKCNVVLQNFCLNVVISGILFIHVWKTKLRCIFLIWIALKPTIFNSNFISLLMIWVYDLNIFYWRKCRTTLIIYKKNTRCLVFKQTIDFCSVWKPQLKIKYHKNWKICNIPI